MATNEKNEPLSHRTSKLVEKLIQQVEEAIERNPAKIIEYTDVIRKVAEITGIEKNKGSKLAVVRLPGLMEIEEFNRSVSENTEFPCAESEDTGMEWSKPHSELLAKPTSEIPTLTQNIGTDTDELTPGEIDWESFDNFIVGE